MQKFFMKGWCALTCASEDCPEVLASFKGELESFDSVDEVIGLNMALTYHGLP
jgi:hypothetical protein